MIASRLDYLHDGCLWFFHDYLRSFCSGRFLFLILGGSFESHSVHEWVEPRFGSVVFEVRYLWRFLWGIFDSVGFWEASVASVWYYIGSVR